eukprot:5820215-Pleurochrysis_carterae.AAC.4
MTERLFASARFFWPCESESRTARVIAMSLMASACVPTRQFESRNDAAVENGTHNTALSSTIRSSHGLKSLRGSPLPGRAASDLAPTSLNSFRISNAETHKGITAFIVTTNAGCTARGSSRITVPSDTATSHPIILYRAEECGSVRRNDTESAFAGMSARLALSISANPIVKFSGSRS